MRIALAQINTTGEYLANLDKVKRFSQKGAAAQADLIVFPEATMIAFGNDLHKSAHMHFRDWTNALSEIAHRTGVNIVAGGFEALHDGKVFNTLIVAHKDRPIDRYDKVHLYDAFGYLESDSVKAGTRPVTTEIAGHQLGLATCYDIRFPKLFVDNARDGASICVVSASWGAGNGKVEQWRLLAQARALDSGTFVVAVDQADPTVTGIKAVAGAPTGVGHSLVTDPFGRILTELDGSERLEIVEVEPGDSEKAKRATAVLKNAKLGY